MSETQTSSPYTFADIEPGDLVRFNGRPGWVVRKGPDVSRHKGHHIMVQFTDGKNKRSTTRLKRNVINKMLEDKRRLWINFNQHADFGDNE